MFAAIRGTDGWSTTALTPPLRPFTKVGCLESNEFFSENLDAEAFQTNPSHCSSIESPLAPESGEPLALVANNLFVGSPLSGAYDLVNGTPAGGRAEFAVFQAASTDFSHIVFSFLPPHLGEKAASPAGEELYEWTPAGVQVVSYLPNGVPAPGRIADAQPGVGATGQFGTAPAMLGHAVSDDGERVVFTAEGRLYIRLNAAKASGVSGGVCTQPSLACTVQVDAAQPGATGTGGGGEFWFANSDGSRVFFTDVSRLTANATARPGEPDLYEYDAETGGLTDLTVVASGAADVLGVVGISDDGSYVYFVADGGELTETHSGENRLPQVGQPNLYLRHDGTTTFIGTLSTGDTLDWGKNGSERTYGAMTSGAATVSRDGEVLAFNSLASLTGSSDVPVQPEDCEGSPALKGALCDQIFVYQVATNHLSCASCTATGVRPTGNAELRPPAATYPRRALMSDGRLFFDTPSALLPQDRDGVSNVYEWVPVGVDGCSEEGEDFSVAANGCRYSLSSGDSPEPSYFVDASEGGENVYFATSQGLVGSDTDNGLSLYDARVEGGFPEPSNEMECGGEECRGASASANPSSSPLSTNGSPGEGNVSAPKGGTSRKQKLMRALAACKKRKKGPARRSCEAGARRRFGHKTDTHKRKAKVVKRGGKAQKKGARR